VCVYAVNNVWSIVPKSLSQLTYDDSDTSDADGLAAMDTK